MSSATHPKPAEHTEIQFQCKDLSDTLRLGSALAAVLGASDLLCFVGPLGAGKSELCRAIIRARAGNDALEVPSPSYTLVNVYDIPGGQIWHADLYRIGDESELDEIGLADAIDDAIVLVEWPERWVNLPPRRLEIRIDPQDDDLRSLTFSPFGPGWEAIQTFLKDFQ